jgi:glycosyltransferase involved in cell wall biosynthesis
LEDWPQKFHELPFSVDTEAFKPKLPENRANSPLIAKAKEIVRFITHDIIKRRQTHFLFVGGLDSAHYFKGVDVMIQAASRLGRNDWKLSIVGEGDRKASYQKLCQDLDIAKQVEFLGAISDAELIRRYQAADCFILPSINRNEAFGIVLIEAMACGLPVIASDLPGVRSVFRPGQEGLYCRPGDVESLRSAMEQMISSQTMRERLGRAARAWTIERYSQEAVKAKLIKIFASL